MLSMNIVIAIHVKSARNYLLTHAEKLGQFFEVVTSFAVAKHLTTIMHDIRGIQWAIGKLFRKKKTLTQLST